MLRERASQAGTADEAWSAALEASLRRLRTDFIDLYLVHTWDGVTHADEVMKALDVLVTSGKVRHVALSNVPAWYAAHAQTLAMWRGYEPVCALQLEYSLAERALEYEYPSLCAELGMNVIAWSPLANGFLTGKYARARHDAPPSGRLHSSTAKFAIERDKRTERNWAIAETLRDVSDRLGVPMPQVALRWVLDQQSVGSVIVGASRASQLLENLGALAVQLPTEESDRLTAISDPPPAEPYAYWPWVHNRMRAGDWRTPTADAT